MNLRPYDMHCPHAGRDRRKRKDLNFVHAWCVQRQKYAAELYALDPEAAAETPCSHYPKPCEPGLWATWQSFGG